GAAVEGGGRRVRVEGEVVARLVAVAVGEPRPQRPVAHRRGEGLIRGPLARFQRRHAFELRALPLVEPVRLLPQPPPPLPFPLPRGHRHRAPGGPIIALGLPPPPPPGRPAPRRAGAARRGPR